MGNEHLSLEVQLVHLGPSEVLCPATCSHCANATVVDAHVQLGAPVILDRMRVDSVRLQSSGNRHELVVDRSHLRSWLSLLVQLHHLAVQHIRLAQRKPNILHVILAVLFWVVVTQFLCKSDDDN